jgi:hypothetical protein
MVSLVRLKPREGEGLICAPAPAERVEPRICDEIAYLAVELHPIVTFCDSIAAVVIRVIPMNANGAQRIGQRCHLASHGQSQTQIQVLAPPLIFIEPTYLVDEIAISASTPRRQLADRSHR